METRSSFTSTDELPGPKFTPFKLCFVIKRENGRSNVKIEKPLKCPETVSPKFHIKSVNEFKCDNLTSQIEKLRVADPQEQFNMPITENMKYGWYQVDLIDTDKRDKRLHFAKRTNVLIKEHLATLDKK